MSEEPVNPEDQNKDADNKLAQPFENEPNPLMDKTPAVAEAPTPEALQEKPAADNEPHPDENAAPTEKFAFFKKQPTYIKILAPLLLLIALIWFGMPKCTSAPPEKTYLIALDASWYPLKLQNKEKSMTNFTKMLFSSIAAAKDLKMRIIESGYLFQLLERGGADGVISFLPPPDDYTTQFITSDPIYQLGFVLVVKQNSSIKTPDKIEGKLIGIIGNAQILIKIAHFPSTIFTRYQNSPQALADLDNGIIDGVVMDVLEASTYVQGLYAGNFRILFPPLISEGVELYLRKSKESSAFVDLFDEGLKEVRANGTYKELLDQWNLINTEEKTNSAAK